MRVGLPGVSMHHLSLEVYVNGLDLINSLIAIKGREREKGHASLRISSHNNGLAVILDLFPRSPFTKQYNTKLTSPLPRTRGHF